MDSIKAQGSHLLLLSAALEGRGGGGGRSELSDSSHASRCCRYTAKKRKEKEKERKKRRKKARRYDSGRQCRRISPAAATCREGPPEVGEEGEDEAERWRDEKKRQQSESVKAETSG